MHFIHIRIWFYLVFPLWLFHVMSPFFCSVLLMHSLWCWTRPGESCGCSQWPSMVLGTGLGGGSGTTEPEETSKEQAAGLQVVQRSPGLSMCLITLQGFSQSSRLSRRILSTDELLTELLFFCWVSASPYLCQSFWSLSFIQCCCIWFCFIFL